MRVPDFALLLICACVAHQFIQVRSVRDGERKAQTDGKRRGRAQRNGSGLKGRFSLKDRTRCSWRAARDGDAFVLGVTCRHGTETFGCEYFAKPSACKQYANNTNAYWRQVARALKKQKKLCHDPTAIVKAGMCRRVHFRLKDVPLPENSRCPARAERLKVAEEKCSSSWSSLCTFLFLMLENDECS